MTDATPEGRPRISIVTPSYDQAAFLEACIQSMISRNYPNLEYIVTDGGSTDGSVEKGFEKDLFCWMTGRDTLFDFSMLASALMMVLVSITDLFHFRKTESTVIELTVFLGQPGRMLDRHDNALVFQIHGKAKAHPEREDGVIAMLFDWNPE